jgi:hypothetical protein
LKVIVVIGPSWSTRKFSGMWLAPVSPSLRLVNSSLQ